MVRRMVRLKGRSLGREGAEPVYTILYSLNSEPWRLASICKEAADWLRRSPALTLMADQFACLSEKYFCILFYSSLHIRDSQFWLKPLDSAVIVESRCMVKNQQNEKVNGIKTS